MAAGLTRWIEHLRNFSTATALRTIRDVRPGGTRSLAATRLMRPAGSRNCRSDEPGLLYDRMASRGGLCAFYMMVIEYVPFIAPEPRI